MKVTQFSVSGAGRSVMNRTHIHLLLGWGWGTQSACTGWGHSGIPPSLPRVLPRLPETAEHSRAPKPPLTGHKGSWDAG